MLYDTHTKKIVFNQTEAHSAPCRDIAMTDTNGDLLYSVGYDNLINIFDTRKKSPASQISANYPFESLDVSQCGGYFAVGNLKGHIYAYDIRNLAEPVKVAKVHDSIVNSVSFILKSNVEERSRVSFEPVQVATATEVTLMANSAATTALASDSPVPAKPDQDSFMGDIDMFLQRRDSMEVQMGRLSTSSRLSTESRGSLNMAGPNLNLMGFLDDISGNNSDPDPMDEVFNQADESFVNVNRLKKRTASIKKQSSVDRTQKSAINLEDIREEPDLDNSRALQEIQTDSNVDSSRPDTAGTKRTSLRRSVDTEDKENQATGVESVTTAKAATSSIDDEEMSETVQNAFRELKLEISNLRQELREEMKEHFYQNQVDRKYTAMATRSQIWMGSFNLWQESQKRLEKIDEVTQTGFGLLLSNDEFTQQFMRLQRENEELKRRLAAMEQRGVKK